MAKFKLVNGVMIKEGAKSDVPLVAVICNPDDFCNVTDNKNDPTAVVIPESTQNALTTFNDDDQKCLDFMQKFKCREDIDSDAILKKITDLFMMYEVPVGLLDKLLELSDYDINIVLDDSGSMGSETDSIVKQACPFMRKHISRGDNEKMTRWEEQEDRLHIMLDFLLYVPTGTVTIHFMNRDDKITLKHSEMEPGKLTEYAHDQLRNACKKSPREWVNESKLRQASTPTFEKLSEVLKLVNGVKTMIYLFTDGVPNGGPEQVARLILNRSNPKDSPITLISCTNEEKECKWMKQIEEDGPFVSETDDFNDERDEVLHDQGPVFPYTYGLWILCMLVGSINPYDLDALDDERPLSKFTMDNVLGRVISIEEYKKYWDSHPNSKPYQSNYSRLSTEQKHTEQIMGKNNTNSLSKIANGMKSLFK